MLKKQPNGSHPRPGEFESIVGPSVTMKGAFRGEGNFRLQGTLEGEIKTKGEVVVEEGATLNGNIAAGTATISGEVTGNVAAKEKAQLTATARVYGDIAATVLHVEPGAVFVGKSIMQKKESAPAAVPVPAKKELPETMVAEAGE